MPHLLIFLAPSHELEAVHPEHDFAVHVRVQTAGVSTLCVSKTRRFG